MCSRVCKWCPGIRAHLFVLGCGWRREQSGQTWIRSKLCHLLFSLSARLLLRKPNQGLTGESGKDSKVPALGYLLHAPATTGWFLAGTPRLSDLHFSCKELM